MLTQHAVSFEAPQYSNCVFVYMSVFLLVCLTFYFTPVPRVAPCSLAAMLVILYYMIFLYSNYRIPAKDIKPDYDFFYFGPSNDISIQID